MTYIMDLKDKRESKMRTSIQKFIGQVGHRLHSILHLFSGHDCLRHAQQLDAFRGCSFQTVLARDVCQNRRSQRSPSWSLRQNLAVQILPTVCCKYCSWPVSNKSFQSFYFSVQSRFHEPIHISCSVFTHKLSANVHSFVASVSQDNNYVDEAFGSLFGSGFA